VSWASGCSIVSAGGHADRGGPLLEEQATRSGGGRGGTRTIDELKGLSAAPRDRRQYDAGIYVLPRSSGPSGGAIQASTCRSASGIARDRRTHPADEADLGVVAATFSGEGAVSCRGLLDELLLIVPPRHPWTKRRESPRGSLAEVPVLMRGARVGDAAREERCLRQPA